MILVYHGIHQKVRDRKNKNEEKIREKTLEGDIKDDGMMIVHGKENDNEAG